jgi:ribosomal protein S18 acetylase RimI-like enzyme
MTRIQSNPHHVPAQVCYRPLTESDIPRLAEIDAEFESHRYLAVEKMADGLNVTWRLTEQPLDPPFASTDYSLDERQRQEVATRLRAADGLYTVVERDNRLIALLDVERERWRDTAIVWNIMIDRRYRQQGLGTELMNRAVAWAKKNNLRALTLETQTNNYAACCFYLKYGFKLCGLDDHFYSNDDIGVKEVALFWWYRI